MIDHDNSYKLLFSPPEMVTDLLKGFVREDWIKAGVYGVDQPGAAAEPNAGRQDRSNPRLTGGRSDAG
jgi:hypothetical protein